MKCFSLEKYNYENIAKCVFAGRFRLRCFPAPLLPKLVGVFLPGVQHSQHVDGFGADLVVGEPTEFGKNRTLRFSELP